MSAWTTRLERFVARQLIGLPASWQTRLSGQPPIQIDGLTLHPEIQVLLAAWKWRGGFSLRADSAGAARASFRTEALRHAIDCELPSVRDFSIETPAGPLPVRHYCAGASGAPLLVFFHGGGFVLGNLDTHDGPCRLLCRHSGLDVLSVDYRLSPEHPFPAAVEDALAAFRWAARHAEDLGADAARVCVGGDSAGGNLSAVVAQQTRRTAGPTPKAQLLIYPYLDALEESPSAKLFDTGFVLDREDRSWFSDQYLPRGLDRSDPRLSPLRIEDASGLAAAYVVTAGFDPLRDDGEAYARKLASAGVRTTLRRYDGFVHGFLNLVGVSPASRAIVLETAAAFGAFVREAPAAPGSGQAELELAPQRRSFS